MIDPYWKLFGKKLGAHSGLILFYAFTSRHPETFHVRRTDLGKEFIAAILQKVKPEYQVHDLSLLRPLVVLSMEVHRVSA